MFFFIKVMPHLYPRLYFARVLLCRAIKKRVKGFPRPLLDLSATNFAKTVNNALNRELNPPFDPYTNGLNFLLASYLIPYVGLTGYVGANPKLKSARAKRVISLC